MRSRLIGMSATVAVFAMMSAPAHADAIDGDWCNSTGKHYLIDGATITIPSGATITGEYNRHGFRYVGPAGDPEEGQEIVMRQLSEEHMVLTRTIGGEQGPAEDWHRCQATS